MQPQPPMQRPPPMPKLPSSVELVKPRIRAVVDEGSCLLTSRMVGSPVSARRGRRVVEEAAACDLSAGGALSNGRPTTTVPRSDAPEAMEERMCQLCSWERRPALVSKKCRRGYCYGHAECMNSGSNPFFAIRFYLVHGVGKVSFEPDFGA